MNTDQQQEQASLYALGALPVEERLAFEAELRGNAELRELVRSLQRAAGLLAMTAPLLAPQLDLKEKVLRRIETAATRTVSESKGTQFASSQRGSLAVSPFVFHGADDPRGWKELPVRGAWIKLLSLEQGRGYAVLLGKLEAGVRYPAHQHQGPEEIYLLSGDLHLGDLSLGPGDFHHSAAGTAHGVNYSVEGCTLLAVLPAEHELVKFAMAGPS